MEGKTGGENENTVPAVVVSRKCSMFLHLSPFPIPDAVA